jgi:hypothetical protein
MLAPQQLMYFEGSGTLDLISNEISAPRVIAAINSNANAHAGVSLFGLHSVPRVRVASWKLHSRKVLRMSRDGLFSV